MKTKDEVRIVGRPEFYTVLYVDMKKAALELGYTLSMHGSMHSDMDLIATNVCGFLLLGNNLFKS